MKKKKKNNGKKEQFVVKMLVGAYYSHFILFWGLCGSVGESCF
jgi:hypothetical protein